ncbi:MAG: hypothetical protein EHM61_01130 [Acidobacteria bacterium]|nr:MAG: hypothetical protein EHM61_01130 [Acidobacteriota bacterium]
MANRVNAVRRQVVYAASVWAFLVTLQGAPTISQVQFPPQVAKLTKFEVTFQVGSTVAQNLQWPYDPAPPPGIPADAGISVDVLFSPDDWQTVYPHPAFYFQNFTDEVRDEKPWNYPTGEFSWKARFSPDRVGGWQFKIRVQDASGSYETSPQSFSVVDSPSRGFVRVSTADSRYFEFQNGEPFVGLGYQGKRLEEADFQTMQKNGIQLIRTWAWMASSVFASQWNPYYELRNQYLGYVPRTGLLAFDDDVTGTTSIKMRVDYEPGGNTGWFDGARVVGSWGTPTEVKPDTRYFIKVVYRGFDIAGPRNYASPSFGFVVKTNINFTERSRCFEPGVGETITNYGENTPSAWGSLEGFWHSGTKNFLPGFYLVLENVTQGRVYVDSVSMREDLGGGQLGAEIMHKPSMEHHLYFQQHASYQLDKVLSLAEKYDVYLKAVILEKGEKILRKIGFDGNFAPDNQDFFYGDFRNTTKVRWLQQAWWRYLQARWGYSPNIHSWELCNEGDPASARHFALADEMGKFMRGRVFGAPVAGGDGVECKYKHPNAHMVTTSFWHSLPSNQFWVNTKYPNLDYADVHAYISTGWLDNPAHETDAALFHLDYSTDCRSNLTYYANQNGLPAKPIVRGECGIDFVAKQQENPDLARDQQGIWLHNYTWAGLDAGALYELYWWHENRETQPGPDGQPGLHDVYRPYFNFLSGIPVNNGKYEDLKAVASNGGIRVVGQKDSAAGRAHGWVQNKQHTWRNVVDGVAISPVSGDVTIGGFAPGTVYEIEWWDTYQIGDVAQPLSKTTSTASTSGEVTVPVGSLTTDVAFKITRKAPPSAPTNLRITKVK